MYVDAHADDALLFQNPDIARDIASGRCVRQVFVTAGDAGAGESYWAGRERGAEVSYAYMAGVSSNWSKVTNVIMGQAILIETLVERPTVSLVFMRLPDGADSGTGTQMYGYQSLKKLWNGDIPLITSVEGSTTYTRQSFIDTLAQLANAFHPHRIATQDYLGKFGDGDNSDHYATAYLARAAHASYSAAHDFVGYLDYGTRNRLPNTFGTDLANKQQAFYLYGQYDSEACSSEARCFDSEYANWLERQYIVGTEPVGVIADAGTRQIVPAGSAVQLNGLKSSVGTARSLAYNWAQTGGPRVTISNANTATPTILAPDAATTLTFSLNVTDGQSTSNIATVQIQVETGPTPSPSPSPTGTSSPVNVARLAVVTASSQNTADSQTAAKAIDGSATGYPKDYTREWATSSGKTGSWLLLSWSSTHQLDHVVLYDRPNTADQITSATLAFSDGTVISVGALPNDGSPLTVTFPPVSTSSLLLTVTGVTSTTQNVGLAEIEAWAAVWPNS